MKKNFLYILGVVIVVLIVVFASYGGDTDSKISKIGFVVPTLDNPFFVDMTEAAQKEADKYSNIKLLVQAPERGATDIEKQIEIVENLISQQIDILVIVPADSRAIIPAIKDANDANIPVIIVDNNLDEEAVKKSGVKTLSYIGSDNFAGGQEAGRFIAEYLSGAGEVAILEGITGTEAAIDRKEGFEDVMKDFDNIEIVASQTANWSREEGLNIFQNILQASPSISAVFASNDEMALGAIQAIKAQGKTGEIAVVGFDAIDDALKAVEEGLMLATIAQQPKEMGRLGVINALMVLDGKEIEIHISVPLGVITADTL